MFKLKKEGKKTCAGAGGITALNEKALDYAVKDGVVEIAFEAELHKIPHSFRRLLGPEFNVHWPIRRV